jgi:type I restriction enzyme S subunit
VRNGKLKKEKPLPAITNEDKRYELPKGWHWVRLGDLSYLVTSGSRDWAKFYSDDGAIFLRMGNLSRGSYRLRLDNIQRVQPPQDGEGARTKLEAGDILISITGEVGLLGLIPSDFGEAYINQHTCLVRPAPLLDIRYLPELFRSPFAQDQFNEPQRGIKNSFRLTDVTEFIVPLPPLAEQHRIVAKVDELIALCDQLETQLAAAETDSRRLLEAVLHDALAPALASATEEAA